MLNLLKQTDMWLAEAKEQKNRWLIRQLAATETFTSDAPELADWDPRVIADLRAERSSPNLGKCVSTEIDVRRRDWAQRKLGSRGVSVVPRLVEAVAAGGDEDFLRRASEFLTHSAAQHRRVVLDEITALIARTTDQAPRGRLASMAARIRTDPLR